MSLPPCNAANSRRLSLPVCAHDHLVRALRDQGLGLYCAHAAAKRVTAGRLAR